MVDTKGLFSLKVGDQFILNGNQYLITDFQIKRVHRLGRIPHCITRREDGKIQYFITNFDVHPVTITETPYSVVSRLNKQQADKG